MQVAGKEPLSNTCQRPLQLRPPLYTILLYSPFASLIASLSFMYNDKIPPDITRTLPVYSRLRTIYSRPDHGERNDYFAASDTSDTSE